MTATMAETTLPEVGSDVFRAVERFLYRESRYADEHRFDEWESLWAGDGVYWIPCGGDDYDPDEQVSLVYDDRDRIAARVRRLKSGAAFAQQPQSRIRRVLSNIEVYEEPVEPTMVRAEANFFLLAVRRGLEDVWAGRMVYRLRQTTDDWEMAQKTVYLVNNTEVLHNMTFLM